MHILLVEDNPGDVLLAREALRELALPHHLSVVHDGESALQKLHLAEKHPSQAPDLVLLDLNLPHISGLDVLSFIKSHQKWDHIPVVVFSTSDAESDVISCYERKANCFLTKPIGFDDLIHTFEKIYTFWNRYSQAHRATA